MGYVDRSSPEAAPPRSRGTQARTPFVWLVLALAPLVGLGCGRPDYAKRPLRPDEVLTFEALYRKHCSGCHGAEGKFGPAVPLNDPLFLALASDEALRRVIDRGRPGTLMPAFGQIAGGPLTVPQVVVLAAGLRKTWGQNNDQSATPSSEYRLADSEGANPPRGDADRGKEVYERACARCHGGEGRGGRAGALRDRAFLGLISDQALRHIITTGRTDLGMPGYASVAGAKPLSAEQVSDLVVLLSQWRREAPAPAALSAAQNQ